MDTKKSARKPSSPAGLLDLLRKIKEQGPWEYEGSCFYCGCLRLPRGRSRHKVNCLWRQVKKQSNASVEGLVTRKED